MENKCREPIEGLNENELSELSQENIYKYKNRSPLEQAKDFYVQNLSCFYNIDLIYEKLKSKHNLKLISPEIAQHFQIHILKEKKEEKNYRRSTIEDALYDLFHGHDKIQTYISFKTFIKLAQLYLKLSPKPHMTQPIQCKEEATYIKEQKKNTRTVSELEEKINNIQQLEETSEEYQQIIKKINEEFQDTMNKIKERSDDPEKLIEVIKIMYENYYDKYLNKENKKKIEELFKENNFDKDDQSVCKRGISIRADERAIQARERKEKEKKRNQETHQEKFKKVLKSITDQKTKRRNK